MHKLLRLLTIPFICLTCVATAQNVNEVINAEKNFAAYALAHNSRDAFMQFLDSANSIEFRNGDAKKSYEIWSLRKPDSTRLIWQPAYAGIAKSGDIGFTTGPWEYKQTANGAVLATGSFATIWHKNSKGEWKYLVDIGTDGTMPAYTVDTVKKFTGAYTSIDATDALTIDRKFIQQYESLHNDAFKAVITPDTWFVLGGKQPLAGGQNILAGLGSIPAGLQFIQMGGGSSDADDIAWVYGTVRREATINNYLRVWQKTKDGFKLLLQVLQ